MSKILEIFDLRASIKEDGREILKGINLSISEGETHAVMGPNGSGKSTLANVIMGNPKYEVTNGEILFMGRSIKKLSTDERAKLGLFMSFQMPEEIDGVKMRQFIINSYRNVKTEDDITVLKLSSRISDYAKDLTLSDEFLQRYTNVGFSGGEKKKGEILQMGILSPKLAILDEIDSGLDIDALKVVAQSITKIKNEKTAVLLITHYQRILNYVIPDFVHVYLDGQIVTTSGACLAKEIEEKGYNFVKAGDAHE
ncbi:MAG TPA: Fe-S cluster assembly ATPase SufC [Petrotogaceae bacterium]|jgi:Fe-S cluster assembly ATP-binding protein|nr:Fe-S cluster assembly ATPase SufC [Petrotogaceae bacterium]HQF32455.1 Fe-S cluster assembly ATPase SufC [Petrotogaceae bacterium]HQH33202.1 Fe-S cluster assembly ATPase SufC [Petrotogaceae bacterium]HQI77926.1 Fe-S cluster assembly ATPase SufC [Petrotogaceae bacterium]